jgi:hypothetical protein
MLAVSAARALRRAWTLAGGVALAFALASPGAHAQSVGDTRGLPDTAVCAAAVDAAELRSALPHGLLFAIALIESGRPDPVTHQIAPWPWTVQSEGQSYYFASKSEAVKWVHAAQARGDTSIDTGCMQVNLQYHPHAFATVDDAFDPTLNADYAAHFLLSLHAATGDWQRSVGFYHSQTLALAVPYQQRVARAWDGLPWDASPRPPPPPTMISMLKDAWGATLVAAPVPSNLNDWSALLHPAVNPVRPLRPHRLKRELLTAAR